MDILSDEAIAKRLQHIIEHIIKTKRLTVRKIARKTGLSTGYLYMIRSGQGKKPRQATAKALREVFNVNTDWILTGEGVQMLPALPKPIKLAAPTIELKCDDSEIDHLKEINSLQKQLIAALTKE